MRMYFFVAMLLHCCFAFAQITPIDSITNDGGFLDEQSAGDATIWTVETKDGNIYFGKVVEWTENEVKLSTDNLGTISIPKEQIVAIETAETRDLNRSKKGKNIKSIQTGKYRHGNRYFLSPSAYTIPKGEWYYQNSMLFFNQVNAGVTDHISVGGGVIPIPVIGPFWLTAKGSIPIVENSVHIGLNSLVGGFSNGFFGAFYGSVTLGTPSSNINAGIGYAFVQDEWSGVPAFVISGTTQVGKKVHLITENYFVFASGEAVGLLSLGARAGFEKVAFDFGLYVPTLSIGSFFAIPVFSLGVPIK